WWRIRGVGRIGRRGSRLFLCNYRSPIGEAIDVADDYFLALLETADDFKLIAFGRSGGDFARAHGAIFEDEHPRDAGIAKHRRARDEQRAIVAEIHRHMREISRFEHPVGIRHLGLNEQSAAVLIERGCDPAHGSVKSLVGTRIDGEVDLQPDLGHRYEALGNRSAQLDGIGRDQLVQRHPLADVLAEGDHALLYRAGKWRANVGIAELLARDAELLF